MTEELPETNRRELNNRRGQYAGKITRASKKIAELFELDVRDLDTPVIEGYQNALAQSWMEWETLHYHIQDTCEVDSRTKEDALLEKVESQVEQLTAKLKNLLMRAGVHPKLQDLQGEIELLLAEEMDQHHATTLKQLQVRFAAVKELGGRHLKNDPTLDRMAADIKKQLQRLTHEVSRSTFPEPTTRDSSRPITRQDSGDSYDQRRGLPKLDIPVFTGNIHEFPYWWTQFDRYVHSVASFEEADKLIYLKKVLSNST